MVAVATDFASSSCYGSVGYASPMATDEVQTARRARLQLAAEKVGGKAALGRLLGYVDGAFVGQMLRGDRPVTEDTVVKLEQKPGFHAWFSGGEKASTLPFRDLQGLEVQLITLFRQLSADHQHEFLVDLNDKVNETTGAASAQNPFAGVERRLSSDRRSATHIDERALPPPNRRRGTQ